MASYITMMLSNCYQLSSAMHPLLKYSVDCKSFVVPLVGPPFSGLFPNSGSRSDAVLSVVPRILGVRPPGSKISRCSLVFPMFPFGCATNRLGVSGCQIALGVPWPPVGPASTLGCEIRRFLGFPGTKCLCGFPGPPWVPPVFLGVALSGLSGSKRSRVPGEPDWGGSKISRGFLAPLVPPVAPGFLMFPGKLFFLGPLVCFPQVPPVC